MKGVLVQERTYPYYKDPSLIGSYREALFRTKEKLFQYELMCLGTPRTIHLRDRDLVPVLNDLQVVSFRKTISAQDNIHHILLRWASRCELKNYISAYLPLPLLEEHFDFSNPNNAFNELLLPEMFHTTIHQFPFQEYDEVIKLLVQTTHLTKNKVIRLLMARGNILWDPGIAEQLMIVAVLNTYDFLLRPASKPWKILRYYPRGVKNADFFSAPTCQTLEKIYFSMRNDYESSYPGLFQAWDRARAQVRERYVEA